MTDVAPMPPADEATSRERIWMAAEKLHLTGVALHAMAGTLDEVSDDIAGQIERLAHRSAELMRAASRLGTSLDVSSAWGIDLLFRSAPETPTAKAPSTARPAPERPVSMVPRAMRTSPAAPCPVSDPAAESVELAPIALLTREVESSAPPRRLQPSQVPQLPLPPLVSAGRSAEPPPPLAARA